MKKVREKNRNAKFWGSVFVFLYIFEICIRMYECEWIYILWTFLSEINVYCLIVTLSILNIWHENHLIMQLLICKKWFSYHLQLLSFSRLTIFQHSVGMRLLEFERHFSFSRWKFHKILKLNFIISTEIIKSFDYILYREYIWYKR